MDTNPAKNYRTAAARGAGPVGLVVLLYEQLMEDLRRAAVKMENQDVEGRTRELDHALVVVGQLLGTLNKHAGGEVARDLEIFYKLMCLSLLQAQMEVSPEILRRQMQNVAMLREAWLEVERVETTASVPSPAAPAPTVSEDGEKSVDWSA